MSNGSVLAFALVISTNFVEIFGQEGSQEKSVSIAFPKQSPPPSPVSDCEAVYNFNSQTNLVSLLGNIRKLVASKELDKAERIAIAALQNIQQTEQNKFYLNQIRKEETKIYYEQAKLAMSREEYSFGQ